MLLKFGNLGQVLAHNSSSKKLIFTWKCCFYIKSFRQLREFNVLKIPKYMKSQNQPCLNSRPNLQTTSIIFYMTLKKCHFLNHSVVGQTIIILLDLMCFNFNLSCNIILYAMCLWDWTFVQCFLSLHYVMRYCPTYWLRVTSKFIPTWCYQGHKDIFLTNTSKIVTGFFSCCCFTEQR